MLWLRFAGVSLLRFATRTFCALLFHEPPRQTRLWPLRRLPSFLQQAFAQSGITAVLQNGPVAVHALNERFLRKFALL